MLLDLKMRLATNPSGDNLVSAQAKSSGRNSAGSKGEYGSYATAYAEPIIEGEVLTFDEKNDDRQYDYY